MLRLLFFLIAVFALGLGFAWLADRPGDIVVTFAGYQYQASLMVAAVAIVATVAAIMITWWVIKAIWNTPHAVSRFFRVRRRDRGYQALSTGMIAAGAGDAGLARRKKKEAMKLISADQEPLIRLLDAQASLLEGDHESARAKFEAMLDDPETRQLGLRGLYLEAQRLGDRTAAHHYAGLAVQEAPQLAWAAESTLEDRTEEGDWDEALRLVDSQKATRQLDRDTAKRRKAVLMTAKAISLLEADPTSAKHAALEANRLAPDLVPAAVTAAKAAFRLGDTRKGSKVLEAIWKKVPHPEIADAYIHARQGDSTHDRLHRAEKLRSMKQNHVESEIVVARAALDANEFETARKAALAALRMEPREGTFLLMADIEEAETGDQGRVREWLARALRAPRDPAWVADGQVAERWAPVSPATGRLDAFEWRPPVERLGQVIEDFSDVDMKPAAMATAGALAAPASTNVEERKDVETVIDAEEPPRDKEVAARAEESVEPEPEKLPEDAKAKPETPDAGENVVKPVAAVPPAPATGVDEAPVGQAGRSEVAVTPAIPEKHAGPEQAEKSEKSAGKASAHEEKEAEREPDILRLPDDPGVDPDAKDDEEKKRFRLF